MFIYLFLCLYHSQSSESRLVEDLLSRYAKVGRIARPRVNSSEVVSVSLGLRLITLDVDEKQQVLTTSVWLRHVSKALEYLMLVKSMHLQETNAQLCCPSE